jgi:hypothetical protein
MACGASCRTWISECDKQGVYLHELGHNLGLRHSGSNIALKGDVITYGDPIAIMGNMWWNDWDTQQFYFAAPQKLQLQWFPPESVLTVVTSGVYRYTFPLPPSRVALWPLVCKKSSCFLKRPCELFVRAL